MTDKPSSTSRPPDPDVDAAAAIGTRYLIRFEQDTLRSRPLRIRVIIEFLGTFLLVTVAAGAGVISFYAGGHPISRTAAVIAPGALVMALIYAWGPLSGLHINPGVTLAFFVRAARGDADQPGPRPARPGRPGGSRRRRAAQLSPGWTRLTRRTWIPCQAGRAAADTGVSSGHLQSRVCLPKVGRWLHESSSDTPASRAGRCARRGHRRLREQQQFRCQFVAERIRPGDVGASHLGERSR